MEHLLGENPTLIVGAVLLVLVGALPALPAVQGFRRWLAVLLPLSTFGLAAAGIWYAFEVSPVLTEGRPSNVVKYAASSLNEAKEPVVLVIDGGSFVLNGVDTVFLRDELHKLGVDARVVKIAAGGANHFERYRVQQQVVKRLRDKPQAQRWIYMTEVQVMYDGGPLAEFAGNYDTIRTYNYTTLGNAWAAARALRSPGVREPSVWRWPLLRHTLINSFSVGALSRFVPEADVEAASGQVSERRHAAFHFPGLGSALQAASEPIAPAMLAWLRDVRERRSQRLWAPHVSDFVYFGVPSPYAPQLRHVKAFCQVTPRKCISPADRQLLEALDSPKYWRDKSHMTRAGAEIYSRWLAQQLLGQGVLKATQ